MSKQLAKGFTMLMFVASLTMVAAVVPAHGQSNPITANVPFDFIVGDKALPAGKYRVTPMTIGGDALKIGNAVSNESALRLTNHAEGKSRNAKLVFHRYGQRYFLAEVWTGQGSEGRQLMKSRQERAIEKENAKIASLSGPAARHSAETVAIAVAIH